ncbi:MAG: PKD domain-containing protein [Candidatus Peribacteraceae bacterium]|nr:PKD domain-containing protein [Candidatus Peribacteraceae bacterium]
MRFLELIKRPSVLLLTLSAFVSAAVALDGTRASDAIVIRLEAGQTVEIGTDTNSLSPQFSWILTKDRQFIGAQRTRFFQTRLADPGTYTLDVSIQDPALTESGYRAFTLLVSAPTNAGIPSPLLAAGSGAFEAILRTDPPTMNGTVSLPPDGGVLMLDPSQSKGTIASYSIDLDSSLDSDGNGDPLSDRDNQGTISERQGTSLFLFMLPKAEPRSVTLTTTDLASGLTTTTSVLVAFSAPPATEQSASGIPSSSGPISVQADGLTVSFNAQLDAATTQGKSLLMEWDFGDRLKSLLESPLHTYGAPGVYTVALTVRDIATGTVLYTGTTSVNVTANLQTEASSSATSQIAPSSSAASNPDTAGSKQTEDGGLPIGAIVTVGFILLLLLGGAVALFFILQWLKGKTTSSLQKTLEKMENTIVKKETPGASPATPEPMKLKKELPRTMAPQEISDKEKAKTEFVSRTRTNETPVTSAGPVPSWLASSGAKNVQPPSPPPATPLPKQAPSPAPSSTAAPGWLTQATPTPAPSAPKPIAAPTPANGGTAVTPPWLAKAQASTMPPAVPAPAPHDAKPAVPAVAPVPPAPAAAAAPPPPVTPPAPTTTPSAPAPIIPPAPQPPAPAPISAPAPAPTPVPIPAPAPTPVSKMPIPATPTPPMKTPTPPPEPRKPEPAPSPQNSAPQMTVKTAPQAPPPKPATAIPPSQPVNTPITPVTPPKSPEQKPTPAIPDRKQPAPKPPAVNPAPAPQPKPAAAPAQPKASPPAAKPSAPANTPPPATPPSVKAVAPIQQTKPQPAPAIKPKEADPPIAIIQADSLNG